MILLISLLSVLFAVQYLTKFNFAMRRISTRAKIRTGRLSYRDIITVSHRQFNESQYTHGSYLSPRSGRFYLSSNGRLYKRIRNNGHIAVKYISLDNAKTITQFYSRHTNQPACITSYNHSSNWTIYRPAAAML